MTGIRRLVLDVLKPHQPSTIELAEQLSVVEGVKGVNIGLYEVDQKTENIKITIEGDSIEYDTLKEQIEKFGAVIHSIDAVAAGNLIVEEVETLQDR